MYKWAPSSAFSSRVKKDTELIQNITNKDIETQIKYMGNPGPGAYELSQNISTGKMQRSQTSKRIRSSTSERPNMNATMGKLYKEDSENLINQYMPNGAHIGPGSYNTTGDLNYKSFQKTSGSIAFKNRAQRFSKNGFGATGEEKFIEQLGNLKLNQDKDNTFKNQFELAKQIRYALENKHGFNSTTERQGLANVTEVPGPGMYIKHKLIPKSTKFHLPFKTDTSRGLLKSESRTTGVSDFMTGIAERERTNFGKDIVTMREKPTKKPINAFKKTTTEIPEPLKHCLLTTITDDRQKDIGGVIGDMHKQFGDNEYGERIVPPKYKANISFNT